VIENAVGHYPAQSERKNRGGHLAHGAGPKGFLNFVALGLALLLIDGCGTVTVTSDPPGADIYGGLITPNQLIGKTPFSSPADFGRYPTMVEWPDGTKSDVKYITGINGDMSVNFREADYVKIVEGPIADFTAKHPEILSQYPDLAVAGGIVCRLPVASDGQVWTVGAADKPLRDVVVGLYYGFDSSGNIVPGRELIPLDRPRQAAVQSRSDGLLAYLPDFPSLRHALTQSPLYLHQTVVVDGHPCWLVTRPYWSGSDLAPDILYVDIYYADPDTGAAPSDFERVAQRSADGIWNAAGSYLLVDTPTRANLTFENNLPVSIQTNLIDEPSLEDFISPAPFNGPAAAVIRCARWRNRMLIAAQNQTLPKLLREAKTSDLTELTTKIEQAILDYTHEAETEKDKAQSALSQDQSGNRTVTDQDRELSLVHEEKVQILKSILAAVKDEIANRNK
jgi:hypothetical protein